MFILLLDGMTGAGKSTTAKLLSGFLPRTAIIGFDRIKRFLSDFERGTRDNSIAKNVLFAMAKSYLDQGISLIIEQAFTDKKEISLYENLALSFDIPIYRFQLYTDPQTAYERITDRQKDKEDKVPEERIWRNIGLFEKRDDFIQINTTDIAPEQVCDQILASIGR